MTYRARRLCSREGGFKVCTLTFHLTLIMNWQTLLYVGKAGMQVTLGGCADNITPYFDCNTVTRMRGVTRVGINGKSVVKNCTTPKNKLKRQWSCTHSSRYLYPPHEFTDNITAFGMKTRDSNYNLNRMCILRYMVYPDYTHPWDYIISHKHPPTLT